MKNTLISIFKIVVSCGLIFILFKAVNIRDLIRTLGSVNIALVFLTLIISGFGQVVLALRWTQVLKTEKIAISLIQSLRLNLIGVFSSNFLPGVFGGDLVRPLHLLRHFPECKLFLYTSVFFERVCGIIGIVILATIGSCWVAMTYYEWQFVFFSGIIGIGIILGFLIMKWFNSSRILFPRFFGRFQNIGYRFSEKMMIFSKNPTLVIKTICCSLLAQCLTIVIYWLLFLAVGVKINPFQVTLAVSLAWLVAIVPISFNGLGLREGSIVYLLAHFGVPHHIAVVVTLIGLLPVLIFSIIGAAVSTLNLKIENNRIGNN
jgi:glycosyltransferase 2 family protein